MHFALDKGNNAWEGFVARSWRSKASYILIRMVSKDGSILYSPPILIEIKPHIWRHTCLTDMMRLFIQWQKVRWYTCLWACASITLLYCVSLYSSIPASITYLTAPGKKCWSNEIFPEGKMKASLHGVMGITHKLPHKELTLVQSRHMTEEIWLT